MSKINMILRFFKNRPFILIAVVIVLIGLVLVRFTLFKSDEGSSSNLATFTVKRGPLRISVTETGSIEAREKMILKSEVRGRTSIISLVDEGVRVKKGDLLVELDSSKLVDERIDHQIRVQNAEAAFVGARENLAVAKNQAQSDVDKAKLAYDFAVQDMKKYLEGEYPNQLKEVEFRIILANEEVTRAEENLEWSKKLFNEKYISQTELQADELAVKRKALDLELARNDLDLLKNFTYKRKLAQLKSDVKQAKMALDRTIRKAKADVVQAEANLKAKKSELERQRYKLAKNEKEIEKTKIYAPADGLVIYATSAQRGGHRGRPREPLAEGAEVRERQDLIHLPTASGVNAEVGVHEASLDKVSIGLPVEVTVDALPGEIFTGRVASIAPLPDAGSAFMNPDLKIYDTVIYLDDNADSSLLRTGMSCTAEIVVEEHRDAIYIPVQAVLRVGGRPTVYVAKSKTLEPRKVEIGLDNNRMVRIISGLEPGEVVSLAPPLASATVEAPTVEKLKIISESAGKAKAVQQDISGKGTKGPGSTDIRDSGSEPRPGRPGGGELTPEQRRKIRERFQSMSPEEREEWRQRRKARQQQTGGGSGEPRPGRPGGGELTPEQRRKIRERFESMSPEEREEWRQRRKARQQQMGGGG